MPELYVAAPHAASRGNRSLTSCCRAARNRVIREAGKRRPRHGVPLGGSCASEGSVSREGVVTSEVGGRDPRGERCVADGAGEGLRAGRAVRAEAARPRARAMETQCFASDGRPFTACWRWVRATPGFFSWSSRSSLSRRTSCGARETARVETSSEDAVSTELEGFPDQLTRVTARVPESTRTTGRTRARVRPIRRAGPRPRRVDWLVVECFTRVRVARGDDLATFSHRFGGWGEGVFGVGR